MQPPFEGGVAAGVGAVDAHVGPFVQQRAVEAFDLAVPGGAPGWEPAVGGTGRGDRVGEGVGAVARPVVGLDGLDVDVVGSKPAAGTAPERDRGDGAFVGEDFAVGDTAVAVDRDVDVGVSDAGVTAPGVIAAAVGSPAAPGGDATELFDVDWDQLAGSGVFDAANDPPGGPVHP